MSDQTFVLGAGMTGLATGLASGLPVYEAEEAPGGICSSYYMSPEDDSRLHSAPKEHWLYIPKSKAAFHRVGFYSNVDSSFLPASSRGTQDRVSIYVEKAYPDGQRPGESEIKALCKDVVSELQEWRRIREAEVVDPTWIDAAYTWAWSKSKWREKALKILEKHDIYQVGRFARWTFQGIADSIRDGLIAGATFQRE